MAEKQPLPKKPVFSGMTALSDKTMVVSFPKEFKMSAFEHYDGSTDPVQHLEGFNSIMAFCGASDAIMCRAFPPTSRKAARTWFTHLEPNSIHEFRQLNMAFTSAFTSSQSYKKTPVKLEVQELDPKVEYTALLARIRDKNLNWELCRSNPNNLMELQARCEKYMMVVETLNTKMDAQDSRTEKKRTEQDEKRSSEDDRKRTRRQSRTPPKYFERYTPFNQHRSKILMQIQNEKFIKWPAKIGNNPNKKNGDKFCHFHNGTGHNIDDYKYLKGEIESLIPRGYLGHYIHDRRNHECPDDLRRDRDNEQHGRGAKRD
ncbi:uncharacterized protein LOC122644797 [Telopea speciosissima]|uniref:uncharacterized protein LOC122644797 n=1 Tax=Telopea speciosissima TaxID=54955 RepID=UPI001CC38978|nr:uncharacterized protein LOC122644797 [Telopea speciosissima]